MRKIIEYSIISADGIFDDPDPIQMGFRDCVDDAYLRDSQGVFLSCDATLWGRSTYEIFAKIYGPGGGTPAYRARLNAMKKYVFSSKLERAEWNNSTLVRGDLVTEVTKLKQQEGGNLLVLGHGLLAQTLLKHRLLDTLDLTIHPALVGRGKPFFRHEQTASLKLASVKGFSKVVKLSYDVQY